MTDWADGVVESGRCGPGGSHPPHGWDQERVWEKEMLCDDQSPGRNKLFNGRRILHRT